MGYTNLLDSVDCITIWAGDEPVVVLQSTDQKFKYAEIGPNLLGWLEVVLHKCILYPLKLTCSLICLYSIQLARSPSSFFHCSLQFLALPSSCVTRSCQNTNKLGSRYQRKKHPAMSSIYNTASIFPSSPFLRNRGS